MKKTETNRVRLLEGPVAKTLINLTLPMVFGILSMVLYNLADTFFVGKLGKEQLAALSFTFPVVLTISSLSQGIGMGASAVISRAIGSEDFGRVRRLATDSLMLGLLIIAAGVTIGLVTIEPLFTLLGARGIVLDYIGEYMRVWYIGMVFVVVPMIGNNILRATGDSKTPSLVMILGAAANLALDPILIFGLGPFPSLGIRGAAFATLIGRGFTFAVSMYVLIHREKILTKKIPRLSEMWKSWREVLHIGIPNAGAKMIIPIGQGFITGIVASYGAAAVAGYGVATRVEFFSLAALNALSSVIGPFIGQNIGAGKIDRVRSAFSVSRSFSLVIGLGLFAVFQFLAEEIAGIFTDTPEVIAAAALYIRIVSLAYSTQGFYLVVSAGLNVLKRPFHAAGLSIIEMFFLSVPLVILGSRLFGIIGIFGAIGLSYLITGIVAWITVEGVLVRNEYPKPSE